MVFNFVEKMWFMFSHCNTIYQCWILWVWALGEDHLIGSAHFVISGQSMFVLWSDGIVWLYFTWIISMIYFSFNWLLSRSALNLVWTGQF